MRKFTPRINFKNWSDSNKRRVGKLIKEGLMTEIGLNKIESYIKTGKVDWPDEQRLSIPKIQETPSFMIKAFTENEPALNNFNTLSVSHQRNYILWITLAKKEQTHQKRLQESIKLLKRNQKLGLK